MCFQEVLDHRTNPKQQFFTLPLVFSYQRSMFSWNWLLPIKNVSNVLFVYWIFFCAMIFNADLFVRFLSARWSVQNSFWASSSAKNSNHRNEMLLVGDNICSTHTSGNRWRKDVKVPQTSNFAVHLPSLLTLVVLCFDTVSLFRGLFTHHVYPTVWTIVSRIFNQHALTRFDSEKKVLTNKLKFGFVLFDCCSCGSSA